MEEDNNTYEALSGDESIELASSDGGETVSDVTPEAISLDELKQILGKDFKDKASALKSVKDTYRFVGKPKEPVIDESKFISREQYEQDMFYSKKPEYDQPEIRAILDSMAHAKNIPHRDVAESPEFKAVFEKVRGYDESQKAKTVLATNPRIAASRDVLQKAAEAAQQGRQEAVETLASQAVMEAYNLS